MNNINVAIESSVLAEMCHQYICKLGTDHINSYKMLDYFYDTAVIKQYFNKSILLNTTDTKEVYKKAIDEWFNEELESISYIYSVSKSEKVKDVIINATKYNRIVKYLDEDESYLYNFYTSLNIKLHNQINTKIFWKVVKMPNFNDCYYALHGEYYG